MLERAASEQPIATESRWNRIFHQTTSRFLESLWGFKRLVFAQQPTTPLLPIFLPESTMTKIPAPPVDPTITHIPEATLNHFAQLVTPEAGPKQVGDPVKAGQLELIAGAIEIISRRNPSLLASLMPAVKEEINNSYQITGPDKVDTFKITEREYRRSPMAWDTVVKDLDRSPLVVQQTSSTGA